MPVLARRRSSFSPALVVTAFTAALFAVACLGWLALGHSITIPFTQPPRVLAFERDAIEFHAPSGKEAIVVAARPIKAYSAVIADDLFDPGSNDFRVAYVSPEAAKVALKGQQIFGRVLKKDKPAGRGFTESDFLPPGTRPGLVAGIPPGKRGIRVEVEDLKGLVNLNPGDRFDVLASIPADTTFGTKDLKDFGGVYGPQLAVMASLNAFMKQATVKVIVQGGVVVTPVETRLVPITTSSLTQGTVTRTKQVQEITVAVDAAEVSPLAAARALKADLLCVPRSGQPGDAADSVTPDLAPTTPFVGPGEVADGKSVGNKMHIVEEIRGSERVLSPVPGAKNARGDGR